MKGCSHGWNPSNICVPYPYALLLGVEQAWEWEEPFEEACIPVHFFGIVQIGFHSFTITFLDTFLLEDPF